MLKLPKILGGGGGGAEIAAATKVFLWLGMLQLRKIFFESGMMQLPKIFSDSVYSVPPNPKFSLGWFAILKR